MIWSSFVEGKTFNTSNFLQDIPPYLLPYAFSIKSKYSQK